MVVLLPQPGLVRFRVQHGLVDFLVMPHTDNEGYGPVVKRLTAELKAKHETVIGLRDDQALYIHGNYIEVF